jgi:DnaJ-class molecular chaperone
MFLEMTEAFAILYDEVTRAKYDSGVGAEALRKEQQQVSNRDRTRA